MQAYRNWLRQLARKMGYRITWRKRRREIPIFRPAFETLEVKITPSTVKWVGASADWSIAANWTDQSNLTHHLPGSTDDAVIDAGVTVTHSTGSDSVRSLSVGASGIASNLSLTGGTVTVFDTSSSTAGLLQNLGTGAIALSGATLANANIASGTTLSAPSGTLFNVTDTGIIDMPRTGGGHAVTVTGNLTINGQVNVRDATAILFNAAGGATQQVTGAGALNLFGSGGGNDVSLRQTGASHTVSFASSLAINASNNSNTFGDTSGGAFAGSWIMKGVTTIPNGTEIGFGSGTFTNDVGGIWKLQPGGTLNLGGNWQNNGTLQITGGTLNIAGNFVQANLGVYTGMTTATVNLGVSLNNATLNLDATTGSWNFGSGLSITGSTINTSGGAVLHVPSATFTNATINGFVDMPRTGGAHGSTILGDLTINTGGKFSLFDGSILAFSAAAGAMQHVYGGGTLDLEGWGGGNDVYLRQTTADHTVQFALGGVDNKAPIVSAGYSSNTIGDPSSGYAGTWENMGTWTAIAGSGGILTFNVAATFLNDAGATWSATGGTFNLAGSWSNAGTIAVAAGTLNVGGSFNGTALGTWSRTGGAVNLTGNAAGGLALNSGTGSWLFFGGAILGGAFSATGTGALVATARQSTLYGVTLNSPIDLTGASANIAVQNNLTLANGLTLQVGNTVGTTAGFISLQGPTNTISALGSATIQFGPNSSNWIDPQTNGEVVTIASNIAIQGGYGRIGGNGIRLFNHANIQATTFTAAPTSQYVDLELGAAGSNDGVITVASGAGMRIGHGGNVADPGWSNAGPINVNGGTLQIGNNNTEPWVNNGDQ